MNLKKESNRRIEIRPIPNRDEVKKFSPQIEFFAQAHVLGPLVDPVTMNYVTGLTEEDIVRLKGEKFPYNLSSTYFAKKAHEFWESDLIKVKLKSTPIFLYPDRNNIDFIKYKWLRKSKFIYSSEEELKEGGKPQATHFIYNETDSNKIKASIIEKKNTLIKKVSSLSLVRKRDFILILLNEVTDNKDENYLTLRFDDIINDSKLSLELSLLLDDSKEETTLKALVKTAIQKNILKRTKKGIFYFETNLGFKEEDVKTFLGKLENQELLISIQEKIK